MAYSQYPRSIFTAAGTEANELIKCGSFLVSEAIEIKNILIPIYKHGTAGGSETLTAKIYSDASYSIALASSAAYTLASISGLTEYWIGNLRFDFSGYPANPNVTYYLGIATANYSPSGDTFFIGAVLDTYDSINTQSDSLKPGAGFVIIGDK